MIIAYAGYRSAGTSHSTNQFDSEKSTQARNEKSEQSISGGFGINDDDSNTDQVMISCVFGELTLNHGQNNILDWFKNLDENKHATLARNKGGLLPCSESAFSTVKDRLNRCVGDSVLAAYGTVGNNQAGYVKLLMETGDFNVISRPTVFAANHQKAVISSGQQIAIPHTGYNRALASGQNMSCEFRDGLLSLDVVAVVNSINELTLEISFFMGKEKSIPNNLTKITIPNNQVVMLGGLFMGNDSKQFTAPRILSPSAIGAELFSSKTNKKTRKEMIILIQPKIIRHSFSLDAGNEVE